jgi:hypothetical protein
VYVQNEDASKAASVGFEEIEKGQSAENQDGRDQRANHGPADVRILP